eukprot:3180486-Rhodomonas_salina.1
MSRKPVIVLFALVCHQAGALCVCKERALAGAHGGGGNQVAVGVDLVLGTERERDLESGEPARQPKRVVSKLGNREATGCEQRPNLHVVGSASVAGLDEVQRGASAVVHAGRVREVIILVIDGHEAHVDVLEETGCRNSTSMQDIA